MAKQITDITKRDLREMLENVDWWGRLEETEFLGRLYSIDELPSYDGRYKTAEQDIWQHRINNADWSNDWIFGRSLRPVGRRRRGFAPFPHRDAPPGSSQGKRL